MKGDSERITDKPVFLLGGARELNDAISDRLGHRGILVREYPGIDDLMSAEVSGNEVILVVDVAVLPEGQDLSSFLKLLSGRLGAHSDFVCIAHSRDLEQRLQALRAGVLAYHVAPVSPDELADWLAERSGRGPSDPYRVLVVDDQPVAATFAARVLDAAGMKTRILTDPMTIFDELEGFRPDLVLMDMYMPEATGIELTSVIREQDEFFRIPVVFLSRESQLDRQLDALRRGGDDFITKPVEPRRLVEVVEGRIQLSRSYNARPASRPDHDPSSGLYNRQSFLKRLNRVLADEAKQEPGCGVLFFELDSPQEIMDRIGLGCRDTLMDLLGRIIRGCLSPADTAGCVGEYSFGVLARRSHERELSDLAESLRRSVAAQDEVGGRGATTVSIGIGLFRPRADDALTMLSRARRSCAKAQRQGGNRVAWYVPLVPATAVPEYDDGLLALVEASLRSGGLELLYHPIVAMRKMPGARYEALLRLRAPDGEYIPPFDFLPVAHARGLMPEIDRWVMGHVLDRLREELRHDHGGLRFYIHQTMESAASDQWVSRLRNQIGERHLIKMRPIIQFQLQDVEEYSDLAAKRFRELHRLGIKICLTQFEDRPETLRMVEQMPLSLVKLSIETVMKTDSDSLSSLVDRLHGCQSAVIAPGIDNPHSIAHLWGCGVDFIQGNFLQFPSDELNFDFSETALQ